MTTVNSKPKVLYIDDEEENLLVFKSSFRRHYQIDATVSVQQAEELLKANTYDMIISDQRMPDLTGVEFLKNLPENLKALRVIMTGYSDIEAVIDALNAGTISKYIRKPWIKEDLQIVLEDALLKKSGASNKKAAIIDQIKAQGETQASIDESPLEVIEQQKQIIRELENEVYETKESVQLLGEIGQEITSTLNLDTILNAVYENINHLMDASVFGIGIYNAAHQTIDYQLAIENGKRYKPYSRSMEDKNQFPVWCIEHKKEVFINDVNKEYSQYISDFKEIVNTLEDGSIPDSPKSFVYMPLMIKDKIIGIITVQSFKTSAFADYHLNTLRNIAIYVATALENAMTYQQIEEQKEVIEKRRDELEQKVEERTEQLRLQKDELEDTFSKLKLLTEIGHEITSTLHLDTILNTVYENVNELMDATVFGIGIYNSEENIIDYRLAIEDRKRYQPYTRTMDDKNQFPVWCIENKKEIYINDIVKDSSKYVQGEVKIMTGTTLEDGTVAKSPISLIYIPLLFDNKPIGVLTVQSYRKFAYNQYHLDILRSLASYITTAIQNAHSYQKMTEAFEQLKSAQSKLVESEKMASLGVLTAGVAHEINNPVNFISGGIQSLKENYDEIKELMKMVIAFTANPSSKELLTELVQKRTELELDELLPEMDHLIQSIKNGAARTSEIVKGLRNFSRLDEDDKKKASIEEGIDSTLIILNNQLKDRISVVKEYGNVPEISCYPGQLNQVLMNIIYNAADAIHDKGEIKIKTALENEMIKVCISDTGKGMSEEVKSKIFQPFFTTKPVGKGTGLGLSISYGIIEKHGGTIEVDSTPGKGTTFTITLPVK